MYYLETTEDFQVLLSTPSKDGPFDCANRSLWLVSSSSAFSFSLATSRRAFATLAFLQLLLPAVCHKNIYTVSWYIKSMFYWYEDNENQSKKKKTF